MYLNILSLGRLHWFIGAMFHLTLSEKTQPAERPKQNLCSKKKLEPVIPAGNRR